MKAFYSPDYVFELGEHTFPTRKWALVAERVRAGNASAELVDPGLPPRELLLLAHGEEWVEKVLAGRLTLADETRLELPWSPGLSTAHQKQVMGTLAACRAALDSGLGLHVGGGSHHACADHGEGFCVFNDLAAALLRLSAEGRIRRGAVVDLDVHQGNGTAAILAGRAGLSTFSMHQEDLYPLDGSGEKAESDLDIGLPRGTSDEKYLKLLNGALGPFLDERRPELVVYQAGVDCREGDLLGGLALTAEGIANRDRALAEACVRRKIPLAVTLGGGYCEKVGETAALHARTLELAADIFGRHWGG